MVSVSGVADDQCLLSDTPDVLQQLLHIANHYGNRYRSRFGASKTKITVTGSKVDMEYYEMTPIWNMENENIRLVWTVLPSRRTSYGSNNSLRCILHLLQHPV